MKIVKVKVYEYNELKEEAKEKALNRFIDINVINVNYDWWEQDGWTGLTDKEIKKRKIKDAPTDLITYSGMYFDLDRNRYVQFVNPEIVDEEAFRKFLRISKGLWKKVSVYFPKPSRSESSTSIDFEEQDSDLPFTEKQKIILERAKEIFNDKIYEVWRGLQKEYDYLTSREAIEETILANGIQFIKDGNIFRK